MSDPENGIRQAEEEDSFCVKLFPHNPILHKNYAYWRNCCFFVNAVRSLRDWFEKRDCGFLCTVADPGKVRASQAGPADEWETVSVQWHALSQNAGTSPNGLRLKWPGVDTGGEGFAYLDSFAVFPEL